MSCPKCLPHQWPQRLFGGLSTLKLNLSNVTLNGSITIHSDSKTTTFANPPFGPTTVVETVTGATFSIIAEFKNGLLERLLGANGGGAVVGGNITINDHPGAHGVTFQNALHYHSVTDSESVVGPLHYESDSDLNVQVFTPIFFPKEDMGSTEIKAKLQIYTNHQYLDESSVDPTETVSSLTIQGGYVLNDVNFGGRAYSKLRTSP